MEMTEQEILEWFNVGKRRGWSHMAILVNNLDKSFRPIYLDVREDTNPKEIAQSQFASTESILEIYNLNNNFRKQVRSTL